MPSGHTAVTMTRFRNDSGIPRRMSAEKVIPSWVVVFGLLLGAGGCGEQTAEQAVRSEFLRTQAAIQSKDPARICALLSGERSINVRQLARQGGPDCRSGVSYQRYVLWLKLVNGRRWSILCSDASFVRSFQYETELAFPVGSCIARLRQASRRSHLPVDIALTVRNHPIWGLLNTRPGLITVRGDEAKVILERDEDSIALRPGASRNRRYEIRSVTFYLYKGKWQLGDVSH